MNMRLLGAPTLKDVVPDMVDASNLQSHIVSVPGDSLYNNNCAFFFFLAMLCTETQLIYRRDDEICAAEELEGEFMSRVGLVVYGERRGISVFYWLGELHIYTTQLMLWTSRILNCERLDGYGTGSRLRQDGDGVSSPLERCFLRKAAKLKLRS
jgi:hypothetical protein